MRTLTATLLAAQRTSPMSPFTRVRLLSADILTEYILTTKNSPRKLYSITHREEAYGSTSVIRFKNNDGYFNSKNLKGYKVWIGWGAVTGAGNEYSNAPELWVLDQREVSAPGEVFTELVCGDIWNLLAKTEVFTGGKVLTGTITGSVDAICEKITGATSGATAVIYAVYAGAIHIVQPTGYSGTFQVGEEATSTSLSITITAVTDIGSGGVSPAYDGTTSVFNIITQMLTGFTTLTLDSDDPAGNVMNYKPKYKVELGVTVRSVIMDVLGFTSCGLRMEADGMHVLYLNPAPATSDYDFDGVHKFKSENRDRAIVTPNRIFVCNRDSSTIYVGSATDTDSYNALGYWLTQIITVESVLSDADAAARAASLISRAKAEANAGAMYAPKMNVGQQVYDWITITDPRNASIVVSGRIGAIERVMKPGEYSMAVRLGGLFTSSDVTPEGLPENNIPAEPVPPASHTVETIPASALAPGAQAYICDLRFTSVDWDTVTWPACTLTLKSGNTQAISSGTKDFANDNPYYAYFVWGNSTLQWTQTYGNCIGEDRGLIGTCKRGTSSTDKAYAQNFFNDSILINRDKVMDNLVNELKLASEAVTEAKIAASAVTEGKISALAVTAGKIAALAVTADKIAADAVTASKIYAGSVTAVKIDAGAIDATKLAAEIVLATTIWAGNNKVRLSSAGIRIDNYAGGTPDSALLQFAYNTAQKGYIYCNSGGDIFLYSVNDEFYVISRAHLDGLILTDGHAIQQLGTNYNVLYDIRPLDTSTWLGAPAVGETPAQKFARGYFDALPTCPDGMPSVDKGIATLRKVGKPKYDSEKKGYYLKDTDAPDEMKVPVYRKEWEDEEYTDEEGRHRKRQKMKSMIDTGEKEIDYIKTIGILTKTVQELIEEVELLKSV